MCEESLTTDLSTFLLRLYPIYTLSIISAIYGTIYGNYLWENYEDPSEKIITINFVHEFVIFIERFRFEKEVNYKYNYLMFCYH